MDRIREPIRRKGADLPISRFRSRREKATWIAGKSPFPMIDFPWACCGVIRVLFYSGSPALNSPECRAGIRQGKIVGCAALSRAVRLVRDSRGTSVNAPSHLQAATPPRPPRHRPAHVAGHGSICVGMTGRASDRADIDVHARQPIQRLRALSATVPLASRILAFIGQTLMQGRKAGRRRADVPERSAARDSKHRFESGPCLGLN